MSNTNMSVGKVRRGLDRVGCLLPWPKTTRETCFFSLRPSYGGPGYFSRKLSREFSRTDIHVTYDQLRNAEAALLFSVSWGEWFHRLSKLWNVKTVLRVDGFMLPEYYDNRSQPSGFQTRSLTSTNMDLNYRIQRDLLLANHVIYQSAFCKDMTDKYLYNRRSDYSIIHNGVDLDYFRPIKPTNRRVRLLSAGSLRHEYMLGTVLPIFSRLWRKHNLELQVVGTLSTICKQQLKEFSENNQEASDRINIVGAVDNDEMPEQMSKADILVHPRLGDWCPNVVIEALACGIPVACGSWGGTAELVGDGGEIVPTEQWGYGNKFVDGMSAAVERIIGSLDIYSAKARQQAEDKFDIRSVSNKYKAAMGLKYAQF